MIIDELVKEVEETKETEEKVETVKEETKQVKSFNVFGKVKNTFHGFFTIAAMIAVIVAIYLFKVGNSNGFSINLPTINISYFRAAAAMAIILIVSAVSTTAKK